MKIKISDLLASKISKITNCVFSGQGGFVIHVMDSLNKIKKIRIVPGQSEQGSSLAADAYTRVSNKIGVVVATSGPGMINTLQGLACSYYDSIPSIYIIGAPVVPSLKKNKNLRQLGFQEMEVREIVKSFTKYAVRITNPNMISYEIDKAIHIATSGRPGPCLIDLPDDIQRSIILKKNQKIFKAKLENKKLERLKKSVKKACNIIKKSKRPIFLIGNGVKISNTITDIKKIINKFQIPYAPTWATFDCFSGNDKLNIGSLGVYASRYGNFSIHNADLLVILGSRLSAPLIGGNPKLFAPKARKIQIDIDPFELKEENKISIDLKINSNLKDFVKLLKKEKNLWSTNKSWIKHINDLKNKYPLVNEKYKKQQKFVNPYFFFNELSKFTKKNDIIIPDASANLVWAYQSYKISKKQKMFTALNHSPMGYSVAAAIGASIAAPKSNVIAIIGDGSLSMNVQELENIKSLNLPIKIFVINNSGYGMIKQTIDTWMNSNYVGCDPKSGLSLPEISKIANSYGIKVFKIYNQRNLKNKIKKILNNTGPIICDVKLHPKQQIIPKVKSGKPLYDMLPSLDEKEIISNIL
jgi:acetolactate synthase I/II/III large subunit